MYSAQSKAWSSSLLIVPYGIEIEILQFGGRSENAFNRTLWN